MAKIYLSPAAHATDNKTKCPTKCGENVHCNQYMDIVEARLKELGFEVLRGGKNLTGSQAMTTRVTEANRAKVDIYYVAHTNAGGGRYSMTMYYPGNDGRAKADVFHKYRKALKHKVKANNALYEIKATSMPCLYDELFFHDNAEDCNWFHNGGMNTLAEETVQALCEICGVAYKPHEDVKPEPQPEPVPASGNIKVGDLVKIEQGAVYSTGKSIPSWVIAKNWYVSSIVSSRAVLGKSEDGKNNINSPVDVKYLTVVNKNEKTESAPIVSNPTVKEWQFAAFADGYKFPKYGADGKWGTECEEVAKKAIVKKRLFYTNENLTKIVQKIIGVPADGLCGKNTDKAIRAWQKANGLTADGAVGYNSWKKMLGV